MAQKLSMLHGAGSGVGGLSPASRETITVSRPALTIHRSRVDGNRSATRADQPTLTGVWSLMTNACSLVTDGRSLPSENPSSLTKNQSNLTDFWSNLALLPARFEWSRHSLRGEMPAELAILGGLGFQYSILYLKKRIFNPCPPYRRMKTGPKS